MFGEETNFKLVHIEAAPVIASLRSQGMDLPDIVYFQGNQGPIKIWEIEYTGKEQIVEKYLDRRYEPYLNWTL